MAEPWQCAHSILTWTISFSPPHAHTEVSTLMAELTPASKRDPAVNHALQVRLSLATGNYRRFFKLFGDAPNMNAYIMDHFVERERVVALSIMARRCVNESASPQPSGSGRAPAWSACTSDVNQRT